MIVACTGHRPERTGGYGAAAFDKLVHIAMEWLSEHKPKRCISGMALGWDQAFAKACVQLRVPFVAAVPFEGQDQRWEPAARRAYRRILDEAHRVCVVSLGGYSATKMHTRNRWIVDHCDLLCAMWDGEPRGGTYGCLQYAERVGKPVVNMYERWRMAR